MNHENLDIIGSITIPSLENKRYDGVHLTLKKGENPILKFQFESMFNHPMKFPVILGSFTGIGDVTFLDCYYIGASSGASGNIVKYTSISYLKGYHFDNPTEIEFDRFIIDVPNLLFWFRKRSISQQRNGDQRTILLTKQEEIEVPINDNILVKFSPSFHESWQKNKTIIEETILIQFEATKHKIKLNELYEYLKSIIKFLIFIQSNEPEINSISLVNNELTYEVNNTKHLIPMHLFLEPYDLKSIGYYLNVFFDTYKEIESEFKEILKNWFNNELLAIIDLSLSKAFVPNLNPENHYLNICFALESFHRQNFNNKSFSEEEYSSRIQYINENITDKNINRWLNEKLKYANEPSFRKRLKELKRSFEILGIKKYKVFIDTVVETRNYLVHRDSKIENRFKGKELFYATRYLEIILKINLLEVLGIAVEKYERKIVLLSDEIESLKVNNS